MTITQSGVALGAYDNISHAKDILVAMILQTGDPIDSLQTLVGYRSDLINKEGQAVAPAESALDFYTGFANPLSPEYSWNQSLPISEDYFIAGNLGLYLGYASELADIKTKNPNLNFDVTSLPQTRASSASVTFGNIQALAIVKNSTNKQGALNIISALTNADAIAFLTTQTNLPPVRLDLLQTPPSGASLAIFYTAALQARGWLDPDDSSTDALFKTMIESVVSGASVSGDVVTFSG